LNLLDLFQGDYNKYEIDIKWLQNKSYFMKDEDGRWKII